MKFRLSKFHLLCFVSKTFLRSLYVLSGETSIDSKNGEDMYKELFVQA